MRRKNHKTTLFMRALVAIHFRLTGVQALFKAGKSARVAAR